MPEVSASCTVPYDISSTASSDAKRTSHQFISNRDTTEAAHAIDMFGISQIDAFWFKSYLGNIT